MSTEESEKDKLARYETALREIAEPFNDDGTKAMWFQLVAKDALLTPEKRMRWRMEFRRQHRPRGMNHFCPGESGTGEWSHLSETVPSVCGYCKQSHKP